MCSSESRTVLAMGVCPGGRVMRKRTGVDLEATDLMVDIVKHAEAK